MTIEGVTQTIVASHNDMLPGNCLQACVATMCHRPLDTVPHFALFNSWHQALNLWLADWYDLQAVIRPVGDEPPPARWGWYMLIGGSPRNPEWSHIVVAHAGRIIWDPHPSREGLTDERQTVKFHLLAEASEGCRQWAVENLALVVDEMSPSESCTAEDPTNVVVGPPSRKDS